MRDVRLLRLLYVAWGGLACGLVMLALWLVTLVVRRPSRAIALQRAASRAMLACLGIRVVVHGEWPPRDGVARLFVANHTSYLDIPLMQAALGRDFVFVTKRELLDWPLISLITRAGGHIPVDRERVESRVAVIGRIVKALRAGRSVLVFPEGTFSHDDRLRPFQAGAFRAAIEAGAPVVPLATTGVADVWSPHAPFPRPGRVEVWICPAVATQATVEDESARVDALRSSAERMVASHARFPGRVA